MREMRLEQRGREWEIVEYEYEGWARSPIFTLVQDKENEKRVK